MHLRRRGRGHRGHEHRGGQGKSQQHRESGHHGQDAFHSPHLADSIPVLVLASAASSGCRTVATLYMRSPTCHTARPGSCRAHVVMACTANGPRPRISSSSPATLGPWPCRILMSARCSMSRAMVWATEPSSPAESRSDGLCATAYWMSPPWPAKPRDRRMSASNALTASGPSRSCRHASSRTTTRWSARETTSRCPAPQEPRHVRAIPTASWGSRDRDRDWIGASQSMSTLVCASNMPASAPLTSWPRASRSRRVESMNCRVLSNRVAATSSGAGLSRACHSPGSVVSVKKVAPAPYPVRSARAVRTTASSLGPNGTRLSPICWDPTSARIRVSHRENTDWARRSASTASSCSQPWASGPRARGLTRAPRPAPRAIGSTPRNRHTPSYSSLVSPRIRARYPKSIIRRMNALVVPDLPMPGLPKHMMFGLLIGTSPRTTQPSGSQWNAAPEATSMPICAPVGGSAGVGMNGQNAGAWSLVIRQVATGAFAGAQPRSTFRGPLGLVGRNTRGSRSCFAGVGAGGAS
ncbi:hypothetical protein [Ornithinimicrobium kibberense]|uniref:hypothetical protein n=1 Tax=Ornithinimicrobium kibberense TaxID=282060 RepID=UPI003614478F